MKRVKRILAVLLLLVFTAPALAAAPDLEKEAIYRTNLGRADDIKLLLGKGISPDLVDENGVPLLALAAARKDAEGINVLRVLLAANVNVNAIDKQGQTALFYAAKEGNKNSVEALLNANINYYAVDNHGDIARNLAHAAGHKEIVQQLDDFVTLQADQVRQKYVEVNREIVSRYQQEQKDAATKQTTGDQQEKLEADQAKAQTVISQAQKEAEAKALAAKRESVEYQNDLRSFAFSNCAFQYWSYVQQMGQSSELNNEELDVVIESHKDLIKTRNKELAGKYKLEADHLDAIAKNAKQRVLNQLDTMPSNTYRREQGVGKIEDLKQRCRTIARSWDQEPEFISRRKRNRAESDDEDGAVYNIVQPQGGEKKRAHKQRTKSGNKAHKRKSRNKSKTK